MARRLPDTPAVANTRPRPGPLGYTENLIAARQSGAVWIAVTPSAAFGNADGAGGDGEQVAHRLWQEPRWRRGVTGVCPVDGCAPSTRVYRIWLPSVSRSSREWGSRIGCGGSGKWLVRRAGAGDVSRSRWSQSRAPLPSRARPRAGRCVRDRVVEHGPVDDVGESSSSGRASLPSRSCRRLCGGRSRRGLRSGLRSWTVAMMCRTRLICRFPARESRCRTWSPEEASMGRCRSRRRSDLGRGNG